LADEPKRIVCDAHGGMLRAIEERWPEAELHQCEMAPAWILSAGLREVEVFWIANVISAHAQDPSAPASVWLVDEFVEGT
jgi:hypothetical protein